MTTTGRVMAVRDGSLGNGSPSRGVVGEVPLPFGPPSADELRHLYVDHDLSMDALAKRWRVPRKTIRRWLVDAGVAIRTRRQTGARRTLMPPPPEELRRLHEIEGLAPAAVGDRLGVSRTTALRWLNDAGIVVRKASLKGRMRGHHRPATPPPADRLRELYEEHGLSLPQLADELQASVHLVRSWLDAAGIPRRRYTRSTRHPPPRRLIQPPPAAELRELRQGERWRLVDLARKYGVHPGTVARWLADYGIASARTRGAIPGVSAAELVRRYTEGNMTAMQLSRDVGVPYGRVLDELHRAGVRTERRRHRPAPKLSSEDLAWAEARYVEDGWTFGPIAKHLGCVPATVRSALKARGVEVTPRPSPARHDRIEAPLDRVERLYVHDRHTAAEVGEVLEVRGGIVLRTGHAHGLPIRPPGPNPIIPTEIQLIDALYADEVVSAVLARHQVTRRPAGGGIAVRFPEPVPLTPELLAALYVEAGCSSLHVELLTGQSEAVVRRRMREWGIQVRNPRTSPALSRIRRERRRVWLEAVVAEYLRHRSTARIAASRGCSQETARRWLMEAGMSLPGRGCWERPTTRGRH